MIEETKVHQLHLLKKLSEYSFCFLLPIWIILDASKWTVSTFQQVCFLLIVEVKYMFINYEYIEQGCHKTWNHGKALSLTNEPKIPGKNWNLISFENKTEYLEFNKKLFKTLEKNYMLCCKILIWHEKSTVYIVFCHQQNKKK